MAPWFQAGTDPAGRINAYSSRTARNKGRINAPPTGDGGKIFCRGAINGALVPGGYDPAGRINAYSSRTARNTGRINAPPTGDGGKIFCRGAINGALVPGGYRSGGAH